MDNKDYEISQKHLGKIRKVTASEPGKYPLHCLSVEKEGIVATCGRALARLQKI